MKKLILLCTMFTWMVNYAADGNLALYRTTNKVISTWENKTVFYTSDKTCFTEIEQVTLYADFTSVKTKKVVPCDKPATPEKFNVQNSTIKQPYAELPNLNEQLAQR